MNFKSVALFVVDLNISGFFYEKILNQKISTKYPNIIQFENGISIWQIKSTHIISQTAKDFNRKNLNFELYFEDDNLDLIEENLKKNNIEFLHSIHEETWGQKTIRFFDPDNNLIEIGETPSGFIGRLYADNMSVEEISQKTNMNIETVKKHLF
jgi:catechol 2,3-dioxygenase-like lactoylglutathione lyase family enzyme